MFERKSSCIMCHVMFDMSYPLHFVCVFPVPQLRFNVAGLQLRGVGILQRKLAANAKWPNWATWSWNGAWSSGAVEQWLVLGYKDLNDLAIDGYPLVI